MIPITIEDLVLAYRKVKVDLWYSGNPCRIKLTGFEDKLEENLHKILDALNNKDEKYLLQISNGYWLCPKKIRPREDDSIDKKNTIFSDPNRASSASEVESFDLRILENAPIAFHVITTLWINKIGERFDSRVSKNAYGNRLRRHKDQSLNLRALGSFNPYLHHYRAWRDNGLKTIRTTLEQNKKVVALTADFAAFYHNINASFIANKTFQSKIGITLTADEQEFTQIVVKMLEHWAGETPTGRGLPVGCSISAVIANAALILFDDSIEKEIIPLYYGRYVDDIILVIENTNDFSSSTAVWEWIHSRVPGVASAINRDEKRIAVNLDAYLEVNTTGKICDTLFFEKEKTKVFLLDYPSGLGFLNSLEHQIRERSSEWRALPELPGDSHVASMLLATCNKSGEDADNLRKADALSARRAMFAMKIRDVESYARSLPPESWREQRQAFLKTIELYFTNINVFFDLFRYFPRILSIATECADYDYVISISNKIFENCNLLSGKKYTLSGERINPAYHSKGLGLFNQYLSALFTESILASLTFPVSNSFDVVLKECLCMKWMKGIDLSLAKTMHCDFSGYDLANKPFRYFYFYKEANWSFGQRGSWATFFYPDMAKKPSFLSKTDFVYLLWLTKHCIKKISFPGVPHAWIFPTRPFNMPELYLYIKNAFDHSLRISKILCAMRGYAQKDEMAPRCTKADGKNILLIQNRRIASKINVTLVSWGTDETSLMASICKKNDPDQSRFHRLSHLLNSILKSRKKIDYVIFPELSIPPRWFLGLANKLRVSGISLIAGVEYLHLEKDAVCNQVWCSLLHDGFGFSQSVVVKHDKNFPAIHEASTLKDVAGIKLVAETTRHSNDIIQHGNFYFGVLICSELTNIDNRAKLRGCVDAIFVPELNPDIEMFGALVEAAAYDIHAYIIQCNDRQFGDTRIRIPAKNHYNRDIVKIKGGEEDFFVVGKLDVDQLRAFQSFGISPTGPDAVFKPVPVGFHIASFRKTLPLRKENDAKN